MPHFAGECDCGRKIHLPKSAVQGFSWTCYKCGKVWVYSSKGKPLRRIGSRPPRAGLEANKQQATASKPGNSASILAAVIIALILLGILAGN